MLWVKRVMRVVRPHDRSPLRYEIIIYMVSYVIMSIITGVWHAAVVSHMKSTAACCYFTEVGLARATSLEFALFDTLADTLE